MSANQQCDEHMPTAYATSNATSICTDGRNGRTELTKNLGNPPEITPSSVTRGRTYGDLVDGVLAARGLTSRQAWTQAHIHRCGCCGAWQIDKGHVTPALCEHLTPRTTNPTRKVA